MVQIFFALFFSFSLQAVEESQDYVYGIDVSAWQDDIDWSLVFEDSFQFCFVKATEGVGWSDPLFETNMVHGSQAGVLMGAYHFATPSVDDAVDEAEYFVNISKAFIKNGFLRPVLDLERGSDLGVETLSNWVRTWMETVEQLTGVEPILYVNSNYANYYVDNSLASFDLWIAHWTDDTELMPDTGIWSDWCFWQYSNQGTVSGIVGNVDLNVFQGNLSDLSGFVIDTDMIYVDDDGTADYTTIQDAIVVANPGDTIFVHAGFYNETVTIDKPLTVIGEHNETTIIDGGKRCDVVIISSDNVCFSGFTVQNSSTLIREGWWRAGIRIIASDVLVENNIIRNNLNGVFVKRVEHLSLRNNLFYNDSLTLYPYDADYDPRPDLEIVHYNHVIEDNLVNDKPLMYMVDESDMVLSSDMGQLILVNCTNISVQDVSISSADFPLLFVFCENCALLNCSFSHNQGECTFLDSDNNIVFGNEFSDNFHGLLLDYGSESNVIRENLFHKNRFCGMICEFFSNENRIVQNDFIDNRGANAFLIKAFHNDWVGNYWSDWIGLKHSGFQLFPKIITGTLFESNQQIVSLIDFDVSAQLEPFGFK